MKSVWTKPEFLGDEYTVSVWYALLKDIPKDLFHMAIQKHALTSTFPPSVAELREQAVSLQQKDADDWSCGWSEVIRAIGQYGYYNEEDALASMSPMTREVVKALGWRQICFSEEMDLGVTRANFRTIYQTRARAIKEQMQLPQDFRNKVKALTEGSELLLGKD